MRAVIFMFCALVASCSGVIGDPPGTTGGPDSFDQAVCAEGPADPGRVTMRRLSRVEYANTLRDLLGDDVDRRAALPADDMGFGFDVIGEVLSTSVNHITAYVDVGFDAVDRAMARDQARPMAERRLLVCAPENDDDLACFQGIVFRFGERAFRRPLTDADRQALGAIFTSARSRGEDFAHAVELTLVAVLTSPSFIFRVEAQSSDGIVEGLGPYELATRLAYFIWSSTPDDALLEAAKSGALATADGVASEARRLLADPRAVGLADHFAAAWLGVSAMADVAPQDASFDEELRAAMAAETKALFTHVLETNAPVSELFSASYTFVNARLARHYGIQGSFGTELSKVAVPSTRPSGILGHASYLTATSHPDLTSPVRRGRFVLDALLCQPPPPPPGDVETKKGEVDPEAPKRTQMEQHRTDAACAGCHAMMDPIGFAFEGFDLVGRPRTTDETGHQVETGGQLVDGTSFVDATDLVSILAADEETLACAAQKLTTFAIGRGLTKSDGCALRAIVDAVRADGGLEDLIVAVATSRPFVARRGAQ